MTWPILEVKDQDHCRPLRWQRHPRHGWGVEVHLYCICVALFSWIMWVSVPQKFCPWNDLRCLEFKDKHCWHSLLTGMFNKRPYCVCVGPTCVESAGRRSCGVHISPSMSASTPANVRSSAKCVQHGSLRWRSCAPMNASIPVSNRLPVRSAIDGLLDLRICRLTGSCTLLRRTDRPTYVSIVATATADHGHFEHIWKCVTKTRGSRLYRASINTRF